jgi:hypothetical protein
MSITTDINDFVTGCLSGASIGSYPTLAKLRDILRALGGTQGYSFTLTHGVEAVVTKPTDLSYTVTKGCALSSTGLPVESLAVREISPTQLGITARYAPPLGALRLTANHTHAAIPHNVETPISWQAVQHSQGANLAWNGSTTITCQAAGIVNVGYSLQYQLVAGNTRRDAIVVDSVAGRFAWTLTNSLGDYCFLSGGQDITVTAGRTLQLRAYQSSGVAVGLYLYNEFTLRFVAPPDNYSANVSVMLLP